MSQHLSQTSPTTHWHNHSTVLCTSCLDVKVLIPRNKSIKWLKYSSDNTSRRTKGLPHKRNSLKSGAFHLLISSRVRGFLANSTEQYAGQSTNRCDSSVTDFLPNLLCKGPTGPLQYKSYLFNNTKTDQMPIIQTQPTGNGLTGQDASTQWFLPSILSK